MPFKNVHYLWKKVKTFTRGHAHFSKAFMVFELIQTYLNWSYLNAIYISDAPKMLEIVKGHWNNSEVTHNYFQDFMKWFSIITKSKQSKISRKRKE